MSADLGFRQGPPGDSGMGTGMRRDGLSFLPWSFRNCTFRRGTCGIRYLCRGRGFLKSEGKVTVYGPGIRK
ncbi:hypothetical protein [Succinimonas amylolytica]|uniref:hypothetical protein n=1 Tax=Succinimonas amylolytica TaxID=83769 RepID=UPI00036A59BD|nr:hypothetical protein [Succinimonas amylolytica]